MLLAIASTTYGASQSGFHYLKQKMLTLDTTQSSSPFLLSSMAVSLIRALNINWSQCCVGECLNGSPL